MSLFGCRTCKAHESEVEFLRTRVKELTDQISNMADNHLQARLEASKHVPSRPQSDDAPAATAPRSGAKRYQNWRSRADRPVPQTPEELEAQTRYLEQEFKVGAEA